jgi:hypothetical protein
LFSRRKENKNREKKKKEKKKDKPIMPMMMLRAAMEGVARSIEVLLKELILQAKNTRGRTCTYM